MGRGALLLSGVTAWAGYPTGLLPGLLIVGAGTGLVFPAASVTTMSDIAGDRAGLASGLMTGAHEMGAAPWPCWPSRPSGRRLATRVAVH